MSHDELSIDIKSENNGDALIFKLRGSLDLATAPSVRAALIEAADEGKHEIIVDLTQLEFLDSTGLGALIGAHRRSLEHDGRVALVVTDGPIARLLNITGLMRVFAVYHTLEAALTDQDRVPAAL
ncbi:MAG TPA: STAS domain-containing protein [Candidatus Baltobacteraceae bacterium]|jgi:anti-sigma B factor antagonist